VSSSASALCSTVQLRLVTADDSVPVPADLRYDPADPFAVTVCLRAHGSPEVEWVVAREVLAAGLRTPAGDGDLGVWPSTSDGDEVVCLSLSSPDGRALLYGPQDDVALFLTRTYAAVPPGRESSFLDIDGLVERLLGCG
jgi:Streptomyces sporulation and cell division protein, SsgA